MTKGRMTVLFGVVFAVGVSASANAELIYGLSTRNQLVTFDSATPGSIGSAMFITGLGASEEIIGIDFRPATGQLYALGSSSTLYSLNVANAVATSVAPMSVQLNGIEFGFDFNPVVDRVRIVSDLDNNLRVNPTTGATTVDVNLAYAAGDPNFGSNPNVTGVAYTNSFSGATSTTLYGIDTTRDVLVIQNPPNNGTLNTVGSLGVNANGVLGFDISGGTGNAYASINTPGGFSTDLYSINLATGAASSLGTIGVGDGSLVLRDLAAVPEPASMILLGLGVAAVAARRRRKIS